MSARLTFNFDLPDDLARFRLPLAVQTRLQFLLDKQDAGHTLSNDERQEAESLVDVSELLTLLKMRLERAAA